MSSLFLPTTKDSKSSGTLTLKSKTLTLKRETSTPAIIKRENNTTENKVEKAIVTEGKSEAQIPEPSGKLKGGGAAKKEVRLLRVESSTATRRTQQLLQTNTIINDLSSTSVSTTPSTPLHDFNAIYRDLRAKFPDTINLSKPVLLAVGIRKEMSQATGVSSVTLKKWIAWYCRKSGYYNIHKQGAPRFNLDGSEAGIVTEKHQEKMVKHLEKVKNLNVVLKNQSVDQENNLSNMVSSNIESK